jgi:RNA recognition motif-containing protein
MMTQSAQDRLFVAGISQETTADHLAAYFESFGTVGDCVVVYDRATGASKGYAFVVCEDQRTRTRILDVKPHIVLDRIVQVTEARGTQTPRGDGTRLFVGGLHTRTYDSRFESPGELFAYFGLFGKVANAYIILDPKTGESRRFGYVEFADARTAKAALEQPHVLRGRRVTLELHRGKARAENGQPPGTELRRAARPDERLAATAPHCSSTRPFSHFYKNLKRTHVQQQTASRESFEDNYVFRRWTTPYLTKLSYRQLTR